MGFAGNVLAFGLRNSPRKFIESHRVRERSSHFPVTLQLLQNPDLRIFKLVRGYTVKYFPSNRLTTAWAEKLKGWCIEIRVWVP